MGLFSKIRRSAARPSRQGLKQFLKHTAHCPNSKLEDHFQFENAETQQEFHLFRESLLSSAHMVAQNRDAEAVLEYENALARLDAKTEIEWTPAPADQKSKFRIQNPIQNPRAGVLRRMGAAVASVCGGVAGAVAGMTLGALEGAVAGIGLEKLSKISSETSYGHSERGGTERARKAADSVYTYLQNKIGLDSFSSLVGGPTGLVLGSFLGALDGAKAGAGLARRAALGENVLARGFKVETTPSKTSAAELWAQLTEAPHSLSSETSHKTSQPWVFNVFSEATAKDLDAQELRRVMEFERHMPEGAEASFHIRRGGLISPFIRRTLRASKLALSVAGLALLGGVVGPASILAAGGRLLSVATGLSAVKEGLRDAKTHGEGHWTGRRTYQLSSRSHKQQDFIQSSPTAQHGAISPVSLKKLSTELESTLQKDGNKVAVFSGHGNSFHSLSGYKPKLVAEALAMASEKTGTKMDLLMLDACNMASVEAMAPMAKGAKFALVSQLPIGKVGLPWHWMLKNLDKAGDDAPALARTLVENFGGSKNLAALSLLNLEKVSELQAQLETLAKSLKKEDASQFFNAGDLATVRDEGFGKKISRRVQANISPTRAYDLGRVLEETVKTAKNEVTREQATKALETLKEAVVVSQGQGLSGLSVEGPSLLFDQKTYTSETGMRAWGEMLSAEQPTFLKPAARLTSLSRQTQKLVRERVNDLLFGAAE